MLHHTAHALGVELALARHEARVVLAHRDMEVGGRVVRKGEVAAILQYWEGCAPRSGADPRARGHDLVIAEDVPAIRREGDGRYTSRASLELALRYTPHDDATYVPESMVDPAIPMIAEVMRHRPASCCPSSLRLPQTLHGLAAEASCGKFGLDRSRLAC
jgi:hypothetical protein